MAEDAIYNRPLDTTALTATESPIQDVSGLPNKDDLSYARPPPISQTSSRASSENRGSDDGLNSSVAGDAQNATTQQPQQKRMPRKLTKNRGNSESGIEKPALPAASPSSMTRNSVGVEGGQAERSRSVLTKRGPQKQSSTNLNELG